MLWRTHVLLGLSSLWIVAGIPGLLSPANAGPMAACAAFGALLPDLDAGTAKIAHLSVLRVRPFAPASASMMRAYGHRGIMHFVKGTLLFGGSAALAVGLWLGAAPALAVLLGYASHLAGDACTLTGIPAMFPDGTRRFLLPKPLRFATGSATEGLLLILFAETSLALYLPLLFRN